MYGVTQCVEGGDAPGGALQEVVEGVQQAPLQLLVLLNLCVVRRGVRGVGSRGGQQQGMSGRRGGWGVQSAGGGVQPAALRGTLCMVDIRWWAGYDV